MTRTKKTMMVTVMVVSGVVGFDLADSTGILTAGMSHRAFAGENGKTVAGNGILETIRGKNSFFWSSVPMLLIGGSPRPGPGKATATPRSQ